MRISAQLVNACNGADVWSHSFDFSGNDELTIQRQIALRLAESVNVTLVEHHNGGCDDWNPLAYECFQKGLDYFRRRSTRNNEYARQMFRKAIEHELCYGRAWAGLAYTLGFEYMSYNHNKSVRKKAVKAAGKANQLNATSVEAHVARGIVKTIQNRPHRADDQFQAANVQTLSNITNGCLTENGDAVPEITIKPDKGNGKNPGKPWKGSAGDSQGTYEFNDGESMGIEATLKEAEKLNAELIVVGTHGHGAVYDVLIGSSSAGIIRRSKLPVLVVPVRDAC